MTERQPIGGVIPPESGPEMLYRYRSLRAGDDAKFTRDIIVNSRLWFASPLSFNDPFDCRPGFRADATNAQLLRFLKRGQQKYGGGTRKSRRLAVKQEARGFRERDFAAEMEQTHLELMQTISVCCLSEVPDDILMWSHYADAHRGLCLVFDGQSTFCLQSLQVLYSDTRTVVNPILHDAKEYALKVLVSKAHHWAYEKEWRIMFANRPPGLMSFPPSVLKAIILGACITPDNEAQVRRWNAERPNPAPLLRAVVEPYRFGVKIEAAHA